MIQKFGKWHFPFIKLPIERKKNLLLPLISSLFVERIAVWQMRSFFVVVVLDVDSWSCIRLRWNVNADSSSTKIYLFFIWPAYSSYLDPVIKSKFISTIITMDDNFYGKYSIWTHLSLENRVISLMTILNFVYKTRKDCWIFFLHLFGNNIVCMKCQIWCICVNTHLKHTIL